MRRDSPTFEIAMGHRVLPEPLSGPGPDAAYTITSDQLDRYLTERVGWWKPTPDALLSGPSHLGARDGVLLTFDDGFRDFRDHALPVLEKHDAHALLFVVTEFASGRTEPYERVLARLLADEPDEYERVRVDLKTHPHAARWAAVDAVAAGRGVSAADFRTDDFLTWDEIVELDRHPLVTIGGHGATHSFLPALSRNELERELETSQSELTERLGRAVPHFSYPYGGNSFGVRRRMRGRFEFGFTTEARTLTARDVKGRLQLPRIDLAEVVS